MPNDRLVVSHISMMSGTPGDPTGQSAPVPCWAAWGYLGDSVTGQWAQQPGGGGPLAAGDMVPMLVSDLDTGDHLTRIADMLIGQFRAAGALDPADPDPVLYWPNATVPSWPLPPPTP